MAEQTTLQQRFQDAIDRLAAIDWGKVQCAVIVIILMLHAPLMLLCPLLIIFLDALLLALWCLIPCAGTQAVPSSAQPLLFKGRSIERPRLPLQENRHDAQGHEEDPFMVHMQSLQKAELMIQRLKMGERAKSLEIEFRFVFDYKNRWVNGRLLHYAVWRASQHDLASRLDDVWQSLRSSEHMLIDEEMPFNSFDRCAESVGLVLRARADINSRGTVITDTLNAQELEAVHFAAGLGCMPALHALLDHVGTPTKQSALVRRPCITVRDDHPVQSGCALHEAAWFGELEALEWLLTHGADASNKDTEGRTALHLLAFRGGPEDMLKDLISRLLTGGASLEEQCDDQGGVSSGKKKTKNRYDPTSLAGKTPLEIASMPGSQFPRHKMYLLAQSWQTTKDIGENADKSCFDDLLVLHRSAADVLARHLRNRPECHMAIRQDAQEYDAANKLANLIYTAPLAAVDILDILTVAPRVPDPMNSPITTRASLKGMFENVPMRCTYQTDVIRDKSGKLKWPMWFVYTREQKPWQYKFLQDVYKPRGGRQEDVYDVKMKVVLLPNILDIDIFWALARTWPVYNKIFLKLAVQGAITCLWVNVIEHVYLLEMSFKAIEMLVLIHWGMSSSSTSATAEQVPAWSRIYQKAEGDVPSHLPLHWTILFSGFVRETYKMGVWFMRYAIKSSTWRRYDRRKAGEASTSSFSPQWTSSLWSLRSFFSQTTAVYEVLFQIMPLGFLLWETRQQDDRSDPQFRNLQSLMAVNIVLRCFRIIVLSRTISGIGRRVVAILNTFVAGSLWQMLSITVAIFFVIFLAFGSLLREQTMGYIGIYLYRGLLFGDGDALDAVGLAPISKKTETDDNEFHHKILIAFMFLSTALFSIIILNLIIAVYEREYNKTEQQSLMVFHQLRAMASVKAMLELSGRIRTYRWLLQIVSLEMLKGGVAAVIIVGFLFAHIEFFPLCVVGGLLIAFGQIAWQVISISTQWLSKSELKEEQERFLWICHRADFDEERSHVGSYEVEIAHVEMLQQRIEQLDAQVHRGMDMLFQRVEGIGAALGGGKTMATGGSAHSAGMKGGGVPSPESHAGRDFQAGISMPGPGLPGPRRG